jgi:hypothetical protein
MARFCRRWADSYLTAKGNSDTLCNSLARSDSGQARPGQGLILAVCASGDASSCQTAELIMAEHKGQGKAQLLKIMTALGIQIKQPRFTTQSQLSSRSS